MANSGLMFKTRSIRHVIASFPGPHSTYFQEQLAAKEVTLELVPQGILCERMRAAAAGSSRVLHDRWRRHGSRCRKRRARHRREALHLGDAHPRRLRSHQGGERR